MGIKELIADFKEKRAEEKEQLKQMERELRLKKRLEQKMKSPQQKEYEFYMREHEKENLEKAIKIERAKRKKKMEELSNPFNKPSIFKDKIDIMKSGMRWI